MMRTQRDPKPWQRIIPLLGIAILPLLSGCIEVEQTLVLKKDGSGVVHLNYAISDERAEQMEMLNETFYADDEGSGGEPLSLNFTEEDIRRDFREFEPYGVRLESVKTTKRDGWTYRNLVISFRDLKGLAQTGFLANRNVSLVRNAKGDYVFTQAGGGASGAVPQYPADPFTQRLFEGFRAVINVRTPGKILQTNAQRKTQDTATWIFDLDEDPEAVQNVQAVAIQIVFAGKGLRIPEYRSPGMSRP